MKSGSRCRNVSTLGFSLAAAIAAKKAFPGRASMAVIFGF
jgi:hypothetical protein